LIPGLELADDRAIGACNGGMMRFQIGTWTVVLVDIDLFELSPTTSIADAVTFTPCFA
jgi:hypothetical protein